MTIRINARLNFVIPIHIGGDEPDLYVHATPLDHEVFKTYAVFLAKVFNAIHTQGIGTMAAPKICAILMEQIATEAGNWDAVRDGLLAEMKRLTNVLVMTDKGWRPTPLSEAIRRNLIDEDVWQEVEGLLAFFIVISHMQPRDEVTGVLTMAAKLWNARVTSSNCTVFAASLPTLTEDDSSPAAPAPKP